MSSIRTSYLAIVGLSALALGACADSTVAPTANIAAPNRPSLNVVVGPAPTGRRELEGQYFVCKVANAGAPQETFNFTYSATKPVGSTQPDLLPGSFSIKNGECASIYQINKEVPVKPYSVTVTEGPMPNSNWAFTSAAVSTISPYNSTILGTAVVNGQTVTGTSFIHDQGAILTITNTYTPPTGQIGDFVWDDVNGNGIQDSGEPGIAGVTVNLGGAASATTTTNSSGAYLFTGLSAGSYTVTVDGTTLPAGYVATATGQGTTATDNNGSPASVTLATGSSVDLSVDFGFTAARGQIGDFVWNDLNGNGVQDSGEPGLSGVTVTLGGASSATTTTNASGAYSFTGLFAGSYTVTVGTPSGFSASPSAQGGDPTKDSNGSPASVTLATNNSSNLTIDFGFVPDPTGQIGNFVWDDVNGNGIQDSGEPGIAGVTVTLSGTSSASTTTDASGMYLFSGLKAGSYTVAVTAATLPSGFVATQTGQGTPATDNNGTPGTVTLATSTSSDLSIDFGYTRALGQIGDFVWNDLNGNGVQDSGEPGLAGVTVTLGGAASATTTTNASGAYSFTGLFAGSYTVTVGTPSGFSASPSAQGGDPAKDSNGSPASVTLASNNSLNLTIDFGFVPNPTGQIGNFVWDDVNGNGIQDSGEPGIAGVTVTLSGTSSASTTTNASGAYLFSGLKAGSYTVTVTAATLPSGFVATQTGQGTAATDNNGSPAGVTLATSTSSDLSIDFGYTRALGQIGDFVWNDLNGNGIQDAGEPGLSGVTVTLGGAKSATTTTNANGAYAFTGLLAGNYTVAVGSVTGFNPTTANAGADPTKDSNTNPSAVTLSANNSTNYTIDFGFVAIPKTGPSCTLTQGYWKNHQELWDKQGERIVWTGQTFFKSGVTYAGIYTMNPSGGNSYIQLAHQYIAAKLNVNGGSDPVINAAIAQAETLLNSLPQGTTFIKNATWTNLATTLDNYNNGVTGPGHCN